MDRLVELGGIPATLSPVVTQQLHAVLLATWSGSNPVDIIGDADPARYISALEILLEDGDSDAVLVMNVQTTIAYSGAIATAVTRVVDADRRKHTFSAKPVLAVSVGAEEKVAKTLSMPAFPIIRVLRARRLPPMSPVRGRGPR